MKASDRHALELASATGIRRCGLVLDDLAERPSWRANLTSALFERAVFGKLDGNTLELHARFTGFRDYPRVVLRGDLREVPEGTVLDGRFSSSGVARIMNGIYVGIAIVIGIPPLASFAGALRDRTIGAALEPGGTLLALLGVAMLLAWMDRRRRRAERIKITEFLRSELGFKEVESS